VGAERAWISNGWVWSKLRTELGVPGWVMIQLDCALRPRYWRRVDVRTGSSSLGSKSFP
jgi:hypothetical protein